MKILIVLRNIGPYHNSRFESLIKINLKVSVFETRPESKEYLWEISENYKYDVYKFPKSLFPERCRFLIEIALTKSIVKKNIILYISVANAEVASYVGEGESSAHANHVAGLICPM